MFKYVLISIASFFMLNMSFGAESYANLNFRINPTKKDNFHLKLNHEINHVFNNGFVLIGEWNYKPFIDHSHHGETGFGFRKFNGQFGYGANFNYALNSNIGFFAHRVSPGLELFWKNFQISINNYFPLKDVVEFKGFNYKFHTVHEFGITYKPGAKYEFGVFPFYNSSSMKWGINSRISVFINEVIELEALPFYKSSGKGISFSFGVHFGGPKRKKIQSIRKTHEFFHTGSKVVKNTEFKSNLNRPEIPTGSQFDAINDVDQSVNGAEKSDQSWREWAASFFFRK